MKKVLFLAALLLVCFSGVTNAQTRKQREDAKREAWKKERQEKKALEAQQDSVSYVQAINALKNGSFVLEADPVRIRQHIMPVSIAPGTGVYVDEIGRASCRERV